MGKPTAEQGGAEQQRRVARGVQGESRTPIADAE
jgi:hypothetical protein